MKKIPSFFFVFCLLVSVLTSLQSQTIERIAFSSGASNNNNFQPFLGMPYSGYLSNANGSLTITAEYGEKTFQHLDIKNPVKNDLNLINIYPNPSCDELNLTFKDDNLIDYDATLFDLNGKVVYNKRIITKEAKIEMRKYEAATYILQIKRNKVSSDIINTYRIVKTK
jgi:hypothetical protein